MSRRYSFHNGNVTCVNFEREGSLKVNRSATGDGNDYTVKTKDYLVAADTNDSILTVTIPSALAKEGNVVIVNDEGGNAGTNNITVATEGSENVDGSGSTTISTNYATLALYSDGSDWYSF